MGGLRQNYLKLLLKSGGWELQRGIRSVIYLRRLVKRKKKMALKTCECRMRLRYKGKNRMREGGRRWILEIIMVEY